MDVHPVEVLWTITVAFFHSSVTIRFLKLKFLYPQEFLSCCLMIYYFLWSLGRTCKSENSWCCQKICGRSRWIYFSSPSQWYVGEAIYRCSEKILVLEISGNTWDIYQEKLIYSKVAEFESALQTHTYECMCVCICVCVCVSMCLC